MAFSDLVRSSLPRARALISPAFMDLRKNFRLNPSLLASSGSLRHNNNHHLSSSTPDLYSSCPTLLRFFSARTLIERGSEPLNKETTSGDGKREKSDQSKQGGNDVYLTVSILGICVVIFINLRIGKSAYEEGVEGKNKGRFGEFKLKLLEPGFVSKIVVDHSLAVVHLKNNAEVGREFFKPDQPIDKVVYLFGIKSPESFKEELENTLKILRLDPVPVIDVTKKNHESEDAECDNKGHHGLKFAERIEFP